MNQSSSPNEIQAAVELGLLDHSQLESIREEQKTSSYSALEIVIRKGFLNRTQLDLLKVFAGPLDVVPGYRIDGFLGKGGVGTVFKATQLRMDRPVAIKTINRAAARDDLTPKRFEREAKIVGQLRHPNIISAFDFGIHDEQLYLVMEFIDGVDAEKLLKQRKRLPELHAWYIARQVCHALENAQQLGVIHRDIKPGNLILTKAPAGTPMPSAVPFVKVADFGLAKFSNTQLDATITMEQSISGTPLYMSPEQVKTSDIDHRSDIYSLGTTIWRMITGEPPVMGTGPLDVISNKMKLEDEWFSKWPSELSEAGFELLKKMCRYDREQRIDVYAELGSGIESIIQQLNQSSSEETDFIVPDDVEFSLAAEVTTIQDRITATAADGDRDPVDDGQTRDFIADEAASIAGYTSDFDLVNSQRRWPVLPLAATALGVLALAAAAWFFLFADAKATKSYLYQPARGINAGEQSLTRLTEFVGPPIFLFNGRDMVPTQRFKGTWDVGKGGEGEAVLSGSGTRDFRCLNGQRKPLKYFRFVNGFRHHEAELIGFRLMDESKNVLFEVEANSTMATLKHDDEEATCKLDQFDDETSFGYHQFRFESQPGHWRIEVDSRLLGEIAKPAGNDFGNHTVQLYATGKGPGHFEQIYFRRLKRN